VELNARFRLLLVLGAVFFTCLIVGDLVGGKLVQFDVLSFPVTLSVGMLSFPVTFLLTDLLNEFYGPKVARFVTWVGLGMALLAYTVIFIAGALPIAAMTRGPEWSGVTDDAFTRVFLASQRIIAGSLVAYLIAQLLDIAVFAALKKLTGSRYLWLRATGSTALSQLIDTAVISTIVWWGVLPVAGVVSVVVSSYVVKLVVALGLTPLIYVSHSLVERWFGLEPLSVPGTLDEDALNGAAARVPSS
jgi:uncharacterized integral membrane protein (TIGR00697 family)